MQWLTTQKTKCSSHMESIWWLFVSCLSKWPWSKGYYRQSNVCFFSWHFYWNL